MDVANINLDELDNSPKLNWFSVGGVCAVWTTLSVLVKERLWENHQLSNTTVQPQAELHSLMTFSELNFHHLISINEALRLNIFEPVLSHLEQENHKVCEINSSTAVLFSMYHIQGAIHATHE